MPEPDHQPSTEWLDVQAPSEAARHTLTLPERHRLERALRKHGLPSLAQLGFEPKTPDAPIPAKPAPRQPWEKAA